jgi:hypothetical protein
MQIGSISSIAPVASAFNPVLAAAQASTKSLPPIASAAPAPPPPADSQLTAQAPPAVRPVPQTHIEQAQVVAAAANAQLESLVTTYSTTVGGTQYTGDVEQTGGEYSASIAGLVGASATGATIIGVENNLNLRISEIV